MSCRMQQVVKMVNCVSMLHEVHVAPHFLVLRGRRVQVVTPLAVRLRRVCSADKSGRCLLDGDTDNEPDSVPGSIATRLLEAG